MGVLCVSQEVVCHICYMCCVNTRCPELQFVCLTVHAEQQRSLLHQSHNSLGFKNKSRGRLPLESSEFPGCGETPSSCTARCSQHCSAKAEALICMAASAKESLGQHPKCSRQKTVTWPCCSQDPGKFLCSIYVIVLSIVKYAV